MKQEFHITVQHNAASIVDTLCEASQLSKQLIKQTMQKGAVWLENGKGIHRVRRADKTAQNNDIIHCYYDEAVLQQIPPTPELISDAYDYSVWNKPSGMLSQGSKWGDHCTIPRWIEQHYTFNDGTQRPCFIVHRLDKATSGLILIAHKKTTASQLASLFERRQIDKRYYAVVKGEFPVKFNQHLDQEPERKPILIESKIAGKLAKTFVSRIHYDTHHNLSVLDVKIETGRKHQIRIHLSNYGYPIIGDRLYGNNRDSNLKLQCYQLQFICLKNQMHKIYTLKNAFV